MSAPIFADVRLDGWTTFRGTIRDNTAVSVRLVLTLGGAPYHLRYFRNENGVVVPDPTMRNGMSVMQSAVNALVSGGSGAGAMVSFATEFERLAHLAHEVAATRVSAQPSNDVRHFSTDGEMTDSDNAYWTFDRIHAPNLFGEWWEVRELYDDARDLVATFNAGIVPMEPRELLSYFHDWMGR